MWVIKFLNIKVCKSLSFEPILLKAEIAQSNICVVKMKPSTVAIATVIADLYSASLDMLIRGAQSLLVQSFA